MLNFQVSDFSARASKLSFPMNFTGNVSTFWMPKKLVPLFSHTSVVVALLFSM